MVLAPACAGGPAEKPTADELRAKGALGFPQADALVLCDRPDLRLSACCDGDDLYVQAIIWPDGDPALGAGEDGRTIGDSSSLAERSCGRETRSTRRSRSRCARRSRRSHRSNKREEKETP